MTDLQDVVEQLRVALAGQVATAPDVLAEMQAALARQADGDRRALALALRAAVLAGRPAEQVGPIPAGTTTVRVGVETYPLAAVNPTALSNPAGSGFPPGWRGPDQAIAVQAPETVLTTNTYGMTVTLASGGRVLTVHDDMLTATSGGMVTTPVPLGGAVLSLHGRARTALAGVRPGMLAEFLTTDRPPPVTRGRTIAGYLMDGQDVDTIPDVYRQIRVAFVRMTGGVLLPVEWGGKTPEQTQAQLTSWAASRPGNRVLLSTGGAGGGNNFGQPSAFVAGYRVLAPLYGAHGVDADEEGQLDGARVVAVCRELRAADPSFVASFVPPGGPPVPVALSAAKQLFDADVPVQFGFQGYDAVDSDDDILDRTADAVAVLDEPSVLVGCMVGDDPAHRTPAEIESLMRKVVARWPDIGGVYAWQIKAPGTTEAMERAAAVLG